MTLISPWGQHCISAHFAEAAPDRSAAPAIAAAISGLKTLLEGSSMQRINAAGVLAPAGSLRPYHANLTCAAGLCSM